MHAKIFNEKTSFQLCNATGKDMNPSFLLSTDRVDWSL